MVLGVAIAAETRAAISGGAVESKDSRKRPLFYRPELDVMRFFAFLGVFFHHTLSRSPFGRMGTPVELRDIFPHSLKFAVSLFFLLSGYLITTLLVMEKEFTGRVHLGAFYKRRIVRIWPLYYSFIVIVLLVGIVVPRLLPSRHSLIAFLFLSGNWFIVRGGETIGAIGILWSVCIEEQFYLVWPLIPKYFGRRGLIWMCVGVTICAYAVLLWLGWNGHGMDVVVRFNTFVEMQFFAVGTLLAVWLPLEGLKIPEVVRLALGTFGLCCWSLGIWWFGETTARTILAWWMPAALYGFVLAGCVAVFVSFFGMPRRWLPPPVMWLGKISYGLYVYHVLVLTLMPRWWGPEHRVAVSAARMCLELLLTVLLAGLSYRWLELPFLRWKASFTFVPNRRV